MVRSLEYYYQDLQGNTRALLDGSGNPFVTYNYPAYGVAENWVGNGIATDTPLEYGGAYTDPWTGLVYDQARWYDPSTGQFLSQDPLAGQTLQPYAYAADDPIDGTDPAGLAPYPKSAVKAAKAAHAAGFRHLLIDMVAIAGAESSWENIWNHGCCYGMWQINIKAWKSKGACKALSPPSNGHWKNPYLNAKCAYTVEHTGGLSQWYDPIVRNGRVSRTAKANGCTTDGYKVCWQIAKSAVRAAGYKTKGMA
ncbi:MAG TPA: RHS repeat-associated core domain-containing protein [Chloroflexota bacterium]|nr:RHS repeat-associated core domain-containing protein [Chloroflexota bacterium]